MSEVADRLPERCPACGAAVRSSVDWCTQCYAPLRSVSTAEPDDPDGSAGSDDADGSDGPSGAVAVAHLGQDAAESGDDTAETVHEDGMEAAAAGSPRARQEAERMADQMLAQLAAEPDPLRSWAARMESAPGGKAGAIVILAVVATVVLLAITYIVASLG